VWKTARDVPSPLPFSVRPYGARRSRRVRAVAALAAGWAIVSLIAGCGGGGASGPGPAPALAVSAMNGWSLLSLPASQFSAQLARMQSHGVQLLRFDASWNAIEPTAPAAGRATMQFDPFDAEVAAMAADHIAWLPILDYSASWAASRPGDQFSPPADDAAFAAYAAAVVRRYGPGGTFWSDHRSLPYEPVRTVEVWNEENGDYFWNTGPSPARYAQLYAATRAAIRRTTSGVAVMVGGLTNPLRGIPAETFLRGMLAADPGLRGHIDAVGLHPYATTGGSVVEAVRSFRALLGRLGERGVPLDITEFGTAFGDGDQEPARAQMMNIVASELARSDCGIGLLAPYDWLNPAGRGQDWGIADATTLRPAGSSWFAALSLAARAPRQRVCGAVPRSAQSG
jgi:hypothetical protein